MGVAHSPTMSLQGRRKRYGQGHTNQNIGMARPDQYEHPFESILHAVLKQFAYRERIA